MIPAGLLWTLGKDILLPVAIALFVFFAGFQQGAKGVREDWQASVAVEQQAQARDLARRTELSSRIETKAVEAQERIRIVTKEVVRVIPQYIPATPVDEGRPPAGDCDALPPGWSVLHNAAAEGRTPPPASDPDGSPSRDAGEGPAGSQPPPERGGGDPELRDVPRDGRPAAQAAAVGGRAVQPFYFEVARWIEHWWLVARSRH